MPVSRDRPLITVGALVLAGLFGVFGPQVPWFSRLELLLDDARMALLADNAPPYPGITVVTIDDSTLAQTRRRSPIDREFLARLLARLNDAQVAAIGMDILFDSATTPDEDGMLISRLHAMTVPIVIADGNHDADPGQITADQAAFLGRFRQAVDNPMVRPGLVRLPRDGDEPIRKTPAVNGAGDDGKLIGSFGNLLAGSVAAPAAVPDNPIAYYGEFHRPPSDHDESDHEGVVGWLIRWMILHLNLNTSGDNASAPGSVKVVDTYPFATIPALTIVRVPDGHFWNNFKQQQLSGRIVLIGEDVEDFDRLPTPFTLVTRVPVPGVMIHASLIAQMLDHRWIRTPSLFEQAALVGLLVAMGFAIGVRFESNAAIIFLMGGLILAWWGAGVLAYWIPVDHGRGRSLYPMVSPAIAAIIATSAGYALRRRRIQAQRNFIEGALGKYVSRSVAEQLMANPALLRVGGERRVVTALFTDIEGFTTLSESLDPGRLVEILNRYLDGMTRIVYDFEGTLDKYIGDAVVALWNAPLERADHAAQAVGCAVALAEFARQFAVEQQEAGIPFGRTRIGLQTGPAIVGNFGGEEKLNYTAIGDTINLASRLEGANKHLGTSILLGEAAAIASKRDDLRPIADLVVKGRAEAVTVFEPVPEWDRESLGRYIAAYEMLRAGDAGALGVMAEIAGDADPLMLLYANRARLDQIGTHIVLDDK